MSWLKNPFRKRVRIVTDSYSGYEVQVWRWWLPFWIQAGGTNTHQSIDRAKEYAKKQFQVVVMEVHPEAQP